MASKKKQKQGVIIKKLLQDRIPLFMLADVISIMTNPLNICSVYFFFLKKKSFATPLCGKKKNKRVHDSAKISFVMLYL